MISRAVLRCSGGVRNSARTSKAACEPLQAAMPWKQVLAVGGSGLAAYYAYGIYTGTYANEASQIAPAANANKVFTGGEQGFISLRLKETENVNHNTKRLRFVFDEADSVSGLSIASAVLTKYKGPQDDKPTLRPYTPISDEGSKGYMDLLVKKYPNGPMSSHMHEMKPGQTLDFKGPLPKYAWSENKHDHIALIAGGTGIAPMFQLTRAIFNNPNDKTKVTLVFGNISEQDILLKQEYEKLENEFPNRMRAFYVLDNPPKDSKVYASGHINKDLLKTVLPSPDKGDAIKVFVCGPPAMYKVISGMKKSPQDQGELSGYLHDLGYSKDQVYKF